MKRQSVKVQPERELDYSLQDNEVADFDNVAYRGRGKRYGKAEGRKEDH